MPSLRHMVSRVRSTHRLLNADNQINDRTIASELRSKNVLLIKRETDKRKLWNTTSLFTALNCIEMKPVSLADCCDFVSDIMVGKSVLQLPKLSEGNYQYLIKGIYNVEGTTKLAQVTQERYFNLMKLNSRQSMTYAWFGEDRHLYCSDPSIRRLKMIAFLEEDAPAEMLSQDCECNPGDSKGGQDPCTNPLDMDFKSPGYLEDALVTLTSQQLLQTYFRIPQDASSDARDGQTK